MSDKDLDILTLIGKLNRVVEREFWGNSHVSKTRLGLPATTLMEHIQSIENVTATKICDVLGIDKSTASRSLKVLEAGGYVVRQRCTGRAGAPLSLTDKAKDILPRFQQTKVETQTGLLRGLKGAELETFKTTLQKIIANAYETCDMSSDDDAGGKARQSVTSNGAKRPNGSTP